MNGNENNQDGNISAVLGSLGRQWLVLKMRHAWDEGYPPRRYSLHSAQHGANNIWKSCSQYLRFSCCKEQSNDRWEVRLSFYLEVNAALKRLKALSTTKGMNWRRVEKDQFDLHETLSVPNLSGCIDDLLVGSKRLMTIGTSIIWQHLARKENEIWEFAVRFTTKTDSWVSEQSILGLATRRRVNYSTGQCSPRCSGYDPD